MTALTIGKQLYNDLQNELGISPVAAAGIVGNLAHETGGFKDLQEKKPLVQGSRGGYGFAQWTGSRRNAYEDWSKQQGLDPASYEANKGFLFHELTNTPEGNVLSSLQNAQTPEEAALTFSNEFLRPGIPHNEKRVEWANKFMANTDNNQTKGYQVELPDGRMLSFTGDESPEEVAQVKQKIRERYFNQTEQPQEQVMPEQQGFFSRTGEALGKRLGKAGAAIERQTTGQQTLPETALQLGWQPVGAAGDVLGNLAISGYQALPEFVKPPIEQAGRILGKLPVAGTDETLGERLPKELGMLGEAYSNWAQENPRAAANIEAIGGLGTTFLPLKGTKTLMKPVESTTKTLKTTGKGIQKLIPKPKDVTSTQLRKEAGKFYDIARQAGGTTKVGIMDDVADDIAKFVSSKGATLPKGAQKAVRSISDPENLVRKAQDIFENMRGEALDLDGFETIDKALGDLAYSASTPDDAARQIIEMQKKLRGTIESISPDQLQGGSKGFEAYKAGRELWAKQAKIRDLENITAKAFATEQPVRSLKRALKRFLADPKNTKGFSTQELEAIKKASDTGVVGNLGRIVTGRLSSRVAAGTGNIPLSAGLELAGQGARNIADDLMLGKIGDINRLIATGQPQTSQFIPSVVRTTGAGIEGAGNVLGSIYTPSMTRGAALGVLREQQ